MANFVVKLHCESYQRTQNMPQAFLFVCLELYPIIFKTVKKKEKGQDVIMEKKWIIISLIVISIVIGIMLGIYFGNRGDVVDLNIKNTQKLADTINSIENTENIQVSNTVETSSINMNISPNAIIIKKSYYKKCDHMIKEVIDIPEELINKKESDVKEKYKSWKLEGYSPTEIVLYKEYTGMCDEHYVVKDNNGVIGIFSEDENGVQEFVEDTDIETKYLPEEDLNKLQAGIEVVGKTNLNNFLEDYE